jgi:hypothetical protein
MDQAIIFQPFIGTMILTMVVWACMYSRRLPFIFSNRIDPRQMNPLEFARISPASVSNPSDNLKNLFELPTVFYAVVIYLYVTNRRYRPFASRLVARLYGAGSVMTAIGGALLMFGLLRSALVPAAA